MARPFEGKVALVTGAGAGIGRAIAVLLAERGAAVIALDVRGEAAEATAAAIRSAGGGAQAVACDVRDGPGVEAGVRAAAAALGPVEVLVNNAGVSGLNAAIEDIDEAAFDRMFGVHVKGALNCLKAVLPGMKARRAGRVVNIASERAQVGFTRSSHYSAAKAALLGFTKAWAKELAPFGIRVNAVAPGVTLTDMTLAHGIEAVREEAAGNLLKRWAEPVEIAYAVAFLAGPEGDFITGQVLCPNGGYPIVGI